MIRKFLVAVVMMLPLMAVAQLGAGQWKIHPYYVGGSAKNCIDTGDKVFYLAGGSLYYFDKASETNHEIDAISSVNDINISQIYYNYSKGYLVIAYKDANIDVYMPSGEVINVPAIKDVVLHKVKTINDITFAPGKVYVATSFGYLVLDDTTFDVKEVRNYDVSVASVAQVGDIKVMSLASKFYYCGADEQLELARHHKQAANAKGDGLIYPINDSKFFLSCSATFQIVTIGHGTDSLGVDTCNFTLKQVVGAKPVTVQPYPAGFVASFGAKNYYYTIAPTGLTYTKVNAANSELYTSQEEGNWWVLGAKGLAHVVNGVPGNYLMPNGISISANAYWPTYDPTQQRVLLCRTSDNRILSGANSGAKTEINSYDGVNWRNITPVGYPNNSANMGIVISPNEPNTYFYCCRTTSGVCKVQNDTVVAQYNTTNSPLASRVGLRFDSKGNLWMPQTRSTNNIDAFVITPENQLKHQVDSSMFVINDMGGICYNRGFKWMVFEIGAGDTKVFTAGDYQSPIIVWTSNDDLSVKQVKSRGWFNDQDGKDVAPWGWLCFKADQDSIIWAGSVDGIISFDPREFFNEDFRVRSIKYTKNEGFDDEGVLLEGIWVTSIDVDNQNRKWIGTNSSGVYFVSADGSEIIKHFDNSNSPLPSDQVYNVCYIPSTNSVMMVTPSGVVEYYMDVTPSEGDYSNVYAYPNPVEPDFTGMITINGLMSNSNVVITNGEGTVVKTMTSNGGIALWDGCDDNGNRVKTGYYNVYASQGETTTTGDPLLKIAIIK